MAPNQDPRLHILEVAFRWYRDAPPGTEDRVLATVGLYAAHGAPFGQGGQADVTGLAIWLEYQAWTTAN